MAEGVADCVAGVETAGASLCASFRRHPANKINIKQNNPQPIRENQTSRDRKGA
jgi:hypothetical protein